MAFFKPAWQTDAIKTDSGVSDKKIQKALLEIGDIQDEAVLLRLACDPANRNEIRDFAATRIVRDESRVQLLLHPVPSIATKLDVLCHGLPPETIAGFLLLYEQAAIEMATAQGITVPPPGNPVETALLEQTHCFDPAIIESAAEGILAEELKWQVYERAGSQAVRYSIVRHINDEQMLVTVATRDPQAATRKAAIERIPHNSASLVSLVLKETCPETAQAALSGITDDDLLLRVVLEATRPEIAQAALSGIADNDLLLRIVLEEARPEIAQVALAGITDDDLLLRIVYETSGEKRQTALARIQDTEKLAQAHLHLGAYDDVPTDLLFTTKNQTLLHNAVEHGIQRAQGKTGVEWFGWMNYIAAALQNCRDRKTLCQVADREDLQPRVRIEAYSRLSGERRLLWPDLIELLEPKEAPDSEASIAERQAAAASLNAALEESESLRKPEAFIRYVRTAIEENGGPGDTGF